MEIRAQSQAAAPGTAGLARLVGAISAHWLLVANSLLGAFVIIPWLAPVFMHLGWDTPGRLIYSIYSLVCHQLPQRSWFLFGNSFTLSLSEIQSLGQLPADVMALRTFIGDAEVGWKVAWSDRMVSFYGGWFLFGLVYALLRSRNPRLNLRTTLLLLLPMFVDGLSHSVSDLWGMGRGFRETNAWLATATGSLAPGFYAGDAWGSFNSLARLGTGLLAAFAVIFFVFPLLDRAVPQQRQNTPARTA